MLKTMIAAATANLALALQVAAAEPFFGFNLNGEAIDPVCIHHMLPWISDGGTIVKSIVLEECQGSNWAYHKGEVEVSGNVVSVDDVEGARFGYEVFGRTASGLFILAHQNTVA